MTTVLIRCRVADYDTWKPLYDRAFEATPEVTSFRVWRRQDDPNHVTIVETFESRAVAEAITTSQATQEAMASDGVEMSSVEVDYLDEADAAER